MIAEVKRASSSQGAGLAYEKLSKILRMIEGLPLSIKGMEPISPVLRNTQPFPPVPLHNTRIRGSKDKLIRQDYLVPKPNTGSVPVWTQSINVNITLETSGKWPKDWDAIQRLKAAFYLKVAELLRAQFKLVVSVSPKYFRVLLNGFVFRVSISSQEELNVARGQAKQDRAAAFVLERDVLYSPKIASFLNHFSQRWPLFGEVCSWAKRWLAAHMLLSYMECEVVELCVAHLFLKEEINSATYALCYGQEKFLHFISSFNWLKAPLILNLNEELQESDIEDIKDKFVSLRPTLPAMCICTPDDRNGTQYTRSQPIPMIVDRMKKLASASLKLIREEGLTTTSKALFQPITSHFDALIELRHRCLPRCADRKEETLKKKKGEQGPDHHFPDKDRVPVTDLDPAACYLEDLRESYDHMALFFHDEFGGDTVGVVWRPSALLPSPVKHSLVNGRKRVTSSKTKEEKLVLNLQAAIQDFRILGKGLVVDVKVQTNNGCPVVSKKKKKE